MKQQGATLAIALLMLLILSIMGISAIQSTHLQEKMSSNLMNKSLSFAAAESALTAGEQWILTLSSEPSVSPTCGVSQCVRDVFSNILLNEQPESFWNTQATPYTQTLVDISTPPRYVIEFIQFIPDDATIGSSTKKSSGVYFYQVTARGTGANNEAVTIIQSTVGRRF